VRRKVTNFIPVAAFKKDGSVVVGNPLHLALKEVVGIVGVDDPHGNARVNRRKLLEKGGRCSHDRCLQFLAGKKPYPIIGV
jgi:hypothetical protein